MAHTIYPVHTDVIEGTQYKIHGKLPVAKLRRQTYYLKITNVMVHDVDSGASFAFNLFCSLVQTDGGRPMSVLSGTINASDSFDGETLSASVDGGCRNSELFIMNDVTKDIEFSMVFMRRNVATPALKMLKEMKEKDKNKILKEAACKIAVAPPVNVSGGRDPDLEQNIKDLLPPVAVSISFSLYEGTV